MAINYILSKLRHSINRQSLLIMEPAWKKIVTWQRKVFIKIETRRHKCDQIEKLKKKDAIMGCKVEVK